MTDNHLIGEDSWTALEILAEETGNIQDCMAQKLPWYPVDAGQFAWALRTYRDWHAEDAESRLMAFPWPKPGEVQDIHQRYFVPTKKARAKIQCFFDNFGGEKEDPWVKDMVGLAKDVSREVQ